MITTTLGRPLTNAGLKLRFRQIWREAANKTVRNIGTFSSVDYRLEAREIAGTITTTRGIQIPFAICIAYKFEADK